MKSGHDVSVRFGDTRNEAPILSPNVLSDRPAAGTKFGAADWRVRGFALLLYLLIVSFAGAQSVQFRASRVRATVPLNSTNTTLITNLVVVSGLSTPVNFDVTGLPVGVGYTLTDASGNPVWSTMTTTNLWLWLYTTNVPQGVHTFSLNGSGGATNSIRLILQAGYVWNGSTNATVDGAGLWSDTTKWLGGGVPSIGDEVVFTDLGGQWTNMLVSGGVTNYVVNCIVDSDVTIGSLRFAQTNMGFQSHHLRINPGRTLRIIGTNGFSLLRDYVEDIGGGTLGFGTMFVTISGEQGRLEVSNANANFSILIPNQQQPTLDMSGLGTVALDVNRVALGDYRAFPNYFHYQNEHGYGSYPRRWPCHVFWARTNIIKARYVDPHDYTNTFMRQYGFIWQNTERFGSGASVNNFFYFGISNYIEADGVCFVGRSQATGNNGRCGFNPAFAEFNPVAIFRGIGGGRMRMFCLGDGGGTNLVSGNTRPVVDFASANGYVDILADQLILSRDAALITSNANPNVESTLTIGKGVVDVNIAILGYQEHQSKTNWRAISGGTSQNYRGYCRGTLNLLTNALFKVNNALILGYTSDTNMFASTPDGEPYNGWGRIVINGGTLMANEILVDPGLGVSIQNWVTLQNGGHLYITNKVGRATKKLEAFTTTASSLTLHIKGADPIIYTTNLNAGTPPSTINVASVENVSAYPVTIPIIAYDTCAAANFVVGRLPSGLVGSIVNNTMNKAIELTLTTNVPKVLVWRGNVSSDWDTTTKNWVTVDGGIATNFTDGDFVVFDDTAVRRTVNIAVDVQPGQSVDMPGILVSNSAGGYTFGGWGRIVGGTRLVKVGTGSLVFDATYEGLVEVVEGSMSGSGEVGTVTVGSGGRLDFGGRISGGLVTAGPVRVLSSGEVVGPVTIQTGGSVTNFGVIRTLTAQVTMQAGSYLVNAAGGLIDARVPWNVPADSTLVNNGVILLSGPIGGNQGLNINAGGTLMGTGLITLGQEGMGSINDARVNINAGGRLIIGNAPNQIAGMGIATRLDFFYGSQTIFDVDPAGGNDVISNKTTYYGYELPGKVNFGANNSQGGTLYINRVGSAQFTPGQVLYLFDRTDNTPDNSIPAPPGVTPAPGPGLAWDISDMITNLTLRVGVPPVLTRTLDGGTNLVFSWPWSYRGWRLERQTNSLSVGLSTNWVTVPGSFVTNYVVVPVGHGYTNFPPNSAIFYRLAYP